jgi:hypothetical protein
LAATTEQQPGGVHGVGGVGQRLAVQQLEFVLVGGDQAGLFDGAAAQEVGDAGADEDAAADVAHHRIAEILQVAALTADLLHHAEDHLADGGVAQVAGEHRHAALQHAAGAQAVEHVVDVFGRKDLALEFAVAGVIGELHRVDHHRLQAEQLQRQGGGGIADVAVGDMGLDGQHQRRLGGQGGGHGDLSGGGLGAGAGKVEACSLPQPFRRTLTRLRRSASAVQIAPGAGYTGAAVIRL